MILFEHNYNYLPPGLCLEDKMEKYKMQKIGRIIIGYKKKEHRVTKL